MELSQFDQGTTAIQRSGRGKEVPHVRLPVQSLQRFETEAKKAIGELAELPPRMSDGVSAKMPVKSSGLPR